MNGGARMLSEGISPSTPGEPGAARANGGCATCGSRAGEETFAETGYVYAVGRLAPQFPDLGVEREFTQLGGGAGAGAGGLETNRLLEILREPATAYLARQLCWVFSAGGVDAFVVAPREDAQTKALVESLPPAEAADQTIQVVIGKIGPPLPGLACAAAALPTVLVDQHLVFPMDAFIDALAAERGSGERSAKADETFRTAARDLFARLTRRSDNRGLADEHRAANYVGLRYPQLYRLAADAARDDRTLVEVHLRRAAGGTRRTVAIRLGFRARRTDVMERYQCLVDVTDRFPFLAAPLAPVYD